MNTPEGSLLSGSRVVVTGASGFLGRHLCRRLRACGAEVHGVSRGDRQTDGHVFRWWKVDLEREQDVRDFWLALKPDLVYHLSGEINGAPTLALLLPTFRSLVTTSVNLLAVSIETATRLILVGSLEEPAWVDAGLTPTSPYAAAKAAVTMYARMCHELFGSHVVILRTFMVYGPGQPAWKLIPSSMRDLCAGVAPRLSSGRRELDWVYVDDAIDAFVAAAASPGVDGTTLDVGSGRLTSIRSVVEHLRRLIDPSVELHFGVVPDRPERPARVADVGTTRDRLGWTPRIPLEDGLRTTVESFRESWSRCSDEHPSSMSESSPQ